MTHTVATLCCLTNQGTYPATFVLGGAYVTKHIS